jgi:hypothetical protein
MGYSRGFLGNLIYRDFWTWVRGILFVYMFYYMVIDLHNFTVFYNEETELVTNAARRYNLICLNHDAEKVRLLYEICKNDKLTRNKIPEWEAFAKLARKKQICGGEDCSLSIWIMLGMVLGGLGVLMLIPKMQTWWMHNIDARNKMVDFPYESGYGTPSKVEVDISSDMDIPWYLKTSKIDKTT